MLVAMGLDCPCEVTPDLAFALESAMPDIARESPQSPAYVIVNPVSERMWTQGHDGSYAQFLESFVDLCRWLLGRGLAVKLLSTQDRMDAGALAHVAGRLQAEGLANWEYCRVTQLGQFMGLARKARLVVSSRLHGLILALVAGTPVVSVAPMRKMTRVMHDAGLADLNLDMSELQRDALLSTVDRALVDETRLRHQIAATANNYRRRLNTNFDQMIGNGLLGEMARRDFSDTGALAARSAK